VMGVHDVGDDVVVASFEIMRSVVKHAAVVGADVGVVARRAVDGVIEAAAETGGNVSKVGKSAIEGAIEEAGKISKMAVITVKEVLHGAMASVEASSRAKASSPATPRAGVRHNGPDRKPQAKASGGVSPHR